MYKIIRKIVIAVICILIKIRLIMMYVYLIHFMIKKVERSYIVPIGMLKMNVEH